MGQSAGPADRPMERMSLVHESVELLLGGLPGRTRVGVVAYNDRASLHPDDVGRSFRDADPDFRLAVVAAEFAEVLRDSPFVEDRSMEEPDYQADRVADELRRDADAEELADLIDAARRIRRR